MSDDLLQATKKLPLAIVVGGCGGMGLACVRRLALTHTVLLADIDIAKAQSISKKLYAEGHSIIAQRCDFSDPASIDALFACAAEIGRVKTLVYVLGLSPSMADWQRIMTVNLVGAAHTAEAALPLMEANGVALFVSSLAAHACKPDTGMQKVLDNPLAPDLLKAIEASHGQEPSCAEAYGLSKAGMNRMCRRLASRWGERGARIVSLSPGLIRTPMGDLEFRNQPSKYQLLERTPLKRQGGLTEIVDAMEFLCSERASFINGTDLLVDGGIAAAVEFGA
ncbi:SDR family oxidoreductase [Pseudomonas sp. PDM31]|uniref:SDR family oxidoreductase n=1 Tax=Pseudomonas sp. PDM31 TaxID=2854778 RepID=UPI001C43C376|nr:SDR family oxidoreductase [Pseudomonas sp. PDM31]MBV7477525.1 SDR family oxidoreductase [Pseudomonas sp. PDM31]